MSREGLEIADKAAGFPSALELIFRFNLGSPRLQERAPGKGFSPAIPQNPEGRGGPPERGNEAPGQPGWGITEPWNGLGGQGPEIPSLP